ncbi:MAG: SUF system Fe-S cluster assembly protein [Gammaproteobacteria bacterium]
MNVYFHSDKLAGKADAGAREEVDADSPLDDRIVDALRQVYDPEIPVNIYDLGLIYDVRVEDDGTVEVDMTLTAPGCPVAQTFPGTVEDAVRQVEGVTEAHVELVWEPPWTSERISDEAKLALGIL